MKVGWMADKLVGLKVGWMVECLVVHLVVLKAVELVDSSVEKMAEHSVELTVGKKVETMELS
jgi:hypothetical protein